MRISFLSKLNCLFLSILLLTMACGSVFLMMLVFYQLGLLICITPKSPSVPVMRSSRRLTTSKSPLIPFPTAASTRATCPTS